VAFVERYIRSDAAGGNDGTQEVDAGGGVGPWTLAEWFGHTEGADRRGNIQSDAAYSIGATTIQQGGDATTLSVSRGYDTAIGDLEGQGRNVDGTLNIDTPLDFPVITLTGQITMKGFVVFESLNITGALSLPLLRSAAIDDVQIISCNITNTQNNASASVLDLDDDCRLINSDFSCTGASHAAVISLDARNYLKGCRIKVTADVACLSSHLLTVSSCLFIGNSGAGIGMRLETSAASFCVLEFCLFYALDTAVQFPDSAITNTAVIVDCHATDCAKYLDNLYIGTANIAVTEINNRTRTNTTPRTGIGDGILIGEITTNDPPNDPDQDYVAVGSENFRLIDGAPGVAAGLIAYSDVGAYQKEAAGGGGGGLLTHPGMSGGMRG
jgi:hypothetical protein